MIDADWERTLNEALDNGIDPYNHFIVMNSRTNEAFADFVYGPYVDEKKSAELGLSRIGCYISLGGPFDVGIDEELEDGVWEVRAGAIEDD